MAPQAFILSMPRRSDFTPGQCVEVTTDPAIPPRAYSIASGRGDPEWELLFTVVPGGLLTPRLAAMSPGDRIYVSEPFGEFRDRGDGSVWIASGTGVAPFASIARSGVKGERTMIHGSRSEDRLFFRELFASVAAYVPCCTQAAGGEVFHGRVTGYLKSHAGRSASLPAEASYLLCGSAEMVVQARGILMARGVPFPKITAEIYF